jgi:3-oxoacyl-[acyl-carrier protein] reductase
MPKVILITGSASGIGKATAELAHQLEYQVILHDKTDSTPLNETHQNMPNSLKTFFDISDMVTTHKAIKTILAKFNRMDVLVNNAGTIKSQDLFDWDDNKAIEEYKVNVLGPIHCIQAVLPKMIEQNKGTIVNISSHRGLFDNASMHSFTYSQTKSAIISMTISLAKALAQYNIRVNTVAPGYTNTGWSKNWSNQSWKQAKEHNYFGRPADPSEIAEAVMFLATKKSSYMTGEVLNVDGGYRIFEK